MSIKQRNQTKPKVPSSTSISNNDTYVYNIASNLTKMKNQKNFSLKCFTSISQDDVILLSCINQQEKNNKTPNGFCCFGGFQGENKRKRSDRQILETFQRELKKLWNMKLTVMPIVLGALGSASEDLEKRLERLEIRGRIETILTIALLRSAKILSGVLVTCEGYH